MKNISILSVLVGFPLVLSPALRAADLDSTSPLPPIKVAVHEGAIAGKAMVDYAALRAQEARIFADLASREFSKLPRRAREVKRAEHLTTLGDLARQQGEYLLTYKKHLGGAINALKNVGPGQMSAAQGDLRRIAATVTADVAQSRTTAGALADVAKLGGGLAPKQEKDFRNLMRQLQRKQAMEEQLEASGKSLADATDTTQGTIEALQEMLLEVDLGVVQANVNVALNTGAIAGHIMQEMSYQLCGNAVCRPGSMFKPGPDYSTLLGGAATGQPGADAAEPTTQQYLDQFARK